MTRILYGPASRTFSSSDLGSNADAVLFDFNGHHELTLTPTDRSWDDIQARLPESWRPELLALSLSYQTIPAWLFEAPVPIIGLAPDWNLLWSVYRRLLDRCDVVLTDKPGVERLSRLGFDHVRAAHLFGLELSFFDRMKAMPDQRRDIDVLFVGNCHSEVQKARLPWLGRLARLADRWNVVIRSQVFGDDYGELLSRSRIVFNRSIRGECNLRVFEAAAAGALLLQERGNAEVPLFLKPGMEFVTYGDDDLEPVIEHFLKYTEERQAIADAAQARVSEMSFSTHWQKAMQSLEGEWDWIRERASQRLERTAMLTSTKEDIAIWSAVRGGRTDLARRVVEHAPVSAVTANAAGLFASNAAMAANCFGNALKLNPQSAVIGQNRAEALAQIGRDKEAIAQAKETLALLESTGDFGIDVAHYPAGFDWFGVEWERAGWSHAGDPQGERKAKCDLIRARLHSLLADLTGNLDEFAAAADSKAKREDGFAYHPNLRAAFACALARSGRLREALPPLHEAITANPFDRTAARALHQVLNDLGDREGRAEFCRDQLNLHRAAPELVPMEEWFRHPPLSGQERTSIIVLACNEIDFTRQCLESVLRHTHGEYELILVDNGSADGTLALFEEMRSRTGPSRVEIVHNDENRGFAAGVNQGLGKAEGEYVVLLNNDTIVTPEWLNKLIGWSLTDWPHVGMVGPMTNYTAAPQVVVPEYRDLSGLDEFSVQRRQLFKGQALEVPRLTGFCLLIRRAVLEAIGGFLDERFGLGFFEDDDLSFHARKAGFKLLAAEDVYIHHFGSRTFAGLGINTEQQLNENFQIFREKWGDEAASHYQMPEAITRGAMSTLEVSDGPVVVPSASEKPKVSLCMMVKNEEHNLPACLESIGDIVDEVVVIDTGSTDRTKQLAASMGARVFDMPWRDSFSAARNAAIEHARGEWIFWMDADDRVDNENREKLKGLFASLNGNNNAYSMKCVCVASAPGETATIVDHVRLFRNDPRIRWSFRVHEQILPAIRATEAGIVWSDVAILHTGYTDEALRKKKLDRDLRLLRIQQNEMPNEPFTMFNLGAVLRELNRCEEALPLLERSLAGSHPSDSIVRKLYSLVAQCHQQLGAYDEALSTCVKGRSIYPDDPELLFVESALLHLKGDRRGAEERLKRLIAGRDSEKHFGSTASGLRGYKARHSLGLLCLEEQRYSEAEAEWRAALLDEPAFFPAQVGIGEALFFSEKWAELEAHADALRGLGARGEVEAEILLGRGMMKRQEWASAKSHIQKAIERFPESLNLRLLNSHAILQEGTDNAAAEEALLGVLAIAPNHPEAQANLAVIRSRQNSGSDVKHGRILFLCPDNPAPSGGVRRLYRHVDVLRANGLDAFVLHEKPGFRCEWFANETPVLHLSHAFVNDCDFLVVPEIYVANIEKLAPGVPKVIFNQNAYFTFRGWPMEGIDGDAFYGHSDVVATLAVSEDNLSYLKYAFPEFPAYRVHYGIDPLFAPNWPKKKIMTYMPRKNADDAVQVLNILRTRGVLNDWKLQSIDRLSEEEVAARLADSAVFLSFGYPEGCPLPPLEAMASGCVVVGYHGRGGREYFKPEFSYPVEAGDIIGFARAVEEMLNKEQDEPGTMERYGKQAMNFVREVYSPEQETTDIMKIWRKILKTRPERGEVSRVVSA